MSRTRAQACNAQSEDVNGPSRIEALYRAVVLRKWFWPVLESRDIGEWPEASRSKSTHGLSDADTFMRWTLQDPNSGKRRLSQKSELSEREQTRFCWRLVGFIPAVDPHSREILLVRQSRPLHSIIQTQVLHSLISIQGTCFRSKHNPF